MLSLEVRKRAGAAEIHRADRDAVTIGASLGNEVVVRARGVAGRHVRICERNGSYHLDLFKGVNAVALNGRQFLGGPISPGDRIAIGEAMITLLATRPEARGRPAPGTAPGATAREASSTLPGTEVEYRSLRMEAYRLCRASRSPEDLATELTDFLDRELPPTEWAVGEFSTGSGFRPIASTFRESPALPPRLREEALAGERLVRAETVAGAFTLILEPPRDGGRSAAILVRENPRLAARALLFLEELVQLAGIALCPVRHSEPEEPALPSKEELALSAASPPTGAETALRQTDDLKKITEAVEREVIDRAMKRLEGNQSRGAQALNISRGSLIAKLKDYAIPDYRYLRRTRKTP